MAGQKTSILLNDYNEIQTKVALVMGTGSGNFGYGQNLFSSQAATNSTVTVTQWKSLRDDILRARQHQLGGDQGNLLPQVTVSDEVSEATRAAYLELSNVISESQNRLATPPATESNTVNLIPAYQRATPWNGEMTQTVTVTFPDSDAARFFFNTGSKILINPVYLPSFGSAKDDNWKLMFDHIATVTFNHTETAFTGAGPATGTSIGWYDLTTTDQQIFEKVSPSFQFAGNRFYVTARRNSDATQLILGLHFVDGAGGDPDINVSGVLTTVVQASRAFGFNVSVPVPPATTDGLQGGAPITPAPPPPPQYGTISISPSVLNYNFQSGQFQTLTLNLKNLGSAAITVDSLKFTVPAGVSGEVVGTGIVLLEGVSVNDTNYVIAPNQQVPVQIKLTAASELVGVVEVEAHALNASSSTATATLNVTVAASPVSGVISVSPLNETFSMFVNGSVTKTFVMSNIGGTSITVDQITFTAPPNVSGGIEGTSYVINPGATSVNTTNYVLAPGASTSININLRAAAQLNGAVTAEFRAPASSNVTTSATLTVNSTVYVPPINPRYSVTASSYAVSEPSAITFTASTQDVSPGTTLYYSISGNAQAADFSESMEGSFTVNSQGIAQVTKNVIADNVTEGSESFVFQVRTDNQSGPIVAYTDPITITDTSGSPAEYRVSADPSTVAEGGSVTFTVSTSNLPNATLYWTISGGAITGADFSDGQLSGSVQISNGSGTVVKSIVSDQLTEGAEGLTFQVKTGSIYGQVVASTNVTITDTSVNIPAFAQNYGAGGPYSIAIPSGITRVYFELNGGGGGGGGSDAGGGGGAGGQGFHVDGYVSVVENDVLLLYVGGAGERGGSGAYAAGGDGGSGYGSGYDGGKGGTPGAYGLSGGGGGGGAGSALLRNGQIVAVAGGGAGGGGAGQFSNGGSGNAGNSYRPSGTYVGGHGSSKGLTDGGGGGGGGGGRPAGNGGGLQPGDNGGNGGTEGSNFLEYGLLNGPSNTNSAGSAARTGGSAVIRYGSGYN